MENKNQSSSSRVNIYPVREDAQSLEIYADILTNWDIRAVNYGPGGRAPILWDTTLDVKGGNLVVVGSVRPSGYGSITATMPLEGELMAPSYVCYVTINADNEDLPVIINQLRSRGWRVSATRCPS